jgi:undecaprenyl diphosphate synthase
MSSNPIHVAIIMDGNSRWAARRYLPRIAGHRAGTNNIRRVVESFAGKGVKYLTIYAFSTENWSRPDDEIMGLMTILEDVIAKETRMLHEKGVKIRHIGRKDRLSRSLSSEIQKAIKLTEGNEIITLNVAFDYGGRTEIIDAVKKMLSDKIPYDEIDEKIFNTYLYTTDTPDPDLIIRTGGELRMSNFLLWQSAYSEYYCTDVLWPDFNELDIDKALDSYHIRNRRFGGRS